MSVEDKVLIRKIILYLGRAKFLVQTSRASVPLIICAL